MSKSKRSAKKVSVKGSKPRPASKPAKAKRSPPAAKPAAKAAAKPAGVSRAQPAGRTTVSRTAAAAMPAAGPVPRKTTVLADGQAGADQFAAELLRPAVLFVVLGNSPAHTRLVERAAGLSGADTDPRWVVHAPDPTSVLPQLAALANPAGLTLAGADGCTLSARATRQLRAVLAVQPEPSLARVFAAYVAAEAP